MPIQNDVGKILANFNASAYNDFQPYGYKWQCVWYVRGRAYEKLKKDTGIRGNGNVWFNSAKEKGLKTGYAPAPNSIACYDRNKYGHVAYVEDVIDNIVYFSEANITGDNKRSDDDGKIKKLALADFEKLNGYQGCIYLTDEKPKFTKPSGGGYFLKTWKNGSTKERVYRTTASCKAQQNVISANYIGYLNPYESADCVGIVDGCYAVVYNASGTKKIGFVKYAGGVK